MSMTLMIRGANPIWMEFDLQGNLFDDSFYLYVLQNVLPYAPATVWQDPDQNIEWTNPIQFLGNGTLPDNIYYEPGAVYRLEFRQNNGLLPPSQNDPLIYEVNNYVAGEGGDTPVDTVAQVTSNQVTNPQFSEINFASPWVLSSISDTSLEVAPGWYLDVVGTGNATITQLALNNSNENPSNAPYALEFNLNGFTSATLRQRFNQNGMLWSSTEFDNYVSNAVTARLNGSNNIISSFLYNSLGAQIGRMLDEEIITQSWQQISRSVLMPSTTNTDTPPAAWIEYRLELPGSVDISITSIQLIASDVPIEPSFDQDSIERQIDHTYHYWDPQLKAKPIPSYLVGWDFYLNPAQPLGKSVGSQPTLANKGYYVWDQTILFQSVPSGINTNGQALSLSAAPAKSPQIGIIQYLTVPDIYSLLAELSLSGLSVNVRCFTTVPQTLNISLWWTDQTLPDLNTGQTLITSLDANGHPTCLSDWNEVSNIYGPATFQTSGGLADYGFRGWFDSNAINSAVNFAIVIGTNVVTDEHSIVIDSISLVPGQIPTIPAPQSIDEVLRECQYYWESSFKDVADFNANPLNNLVFLPQELYVDAASLGTKISMYATPGYVSFKNPKIVNPTLTFYSAAKTIANASSNVWYDNAGIQSLGISDKVMDTFYVISAKTNSFYLNPKIVTPLRTYAGPMTSNFSSGAISFHWTADSRLGVV